MKTKTYNYTYDSIADAAKVDVRKVRLDASRKNFCPWDLRSVAAYIVHSFLETNDMKYGKEAKVIEVKRLVGDWDKEEKA